jgi:prevent-host-death family protein
MDVAISEFRAGLREWVERARRGEDVIVTERGLPVARLVAVDAAPALERLEREGLVTPAASERPRASTRSRVQATGPVAELVTDLRR